MDTSPNLSIVIPCYRSGARLWELVDRIAATMRGSGRSFEILLVNDGSDDNTWTVIDELADTFSFVRGFNLLFNAGQFRATICGLEQARGDLLVTMDDDLQHCPEDIPKLIQKFEQNPNVDCVVGTFERRHQNLLRRLGSQLAGYFNWWLYGKPPELRLSSFRLMSRITAIAVCAHQTARPVIGPILLRCTSRIVNVTVEHRPRAGGRSGYTLRRLAGTLFDNIIAGSTFPLKAVALLGFLSASGSLLLGIYYMVSYLFGGIRLPGFATQVLLITFFGGMTLFSIGLLGEYVIRIIHETSRAPRYIIRDKTIPKRDETSEPEPEAIAEPSPANE